MPNAANCIYFKYIRTIHGWVYEYVCESVVEKKEKRLNYKKAKFFLFKKK